MWKHSIRKGQPDRLFLIPKGEKERGKDYEAICNNHAICFAAIGGQSEQFLEGFDGFLYALIVFVVVDYITGLMAAVINKEVSVRLVFTES